MHRVKKKIEDKVVKRELCYKNELRNELKIASFKMKSCLYLTSLYLLVEWK